jgi:hypothetical protein
MCGARRETIAGVVDLFPNVSARFTHVSERPPAVGSGHAPLGERRVESAPGAATTS